jgi:hypothetical protein
MPCVDYGRAYKKYYDPDEIIIDLETVTAHGNTTTHDVEVYGSVTTDGLFIGDGSFVTNVPSNPGVPDLQTVTGYGASTGDKVSFSDVYADGNVVVNGIVTCSELIGNGEFLGGVANVYELSALDSKITATESNIIITNTSGLTDVTKGDLLASTSDGVLDKLSIGTTNQVLHANTTTEQPEWVGISGVTDVVNRALAIEQNPMFSNTNNLTSMNTGDILYGHETGDLRNLARETTADNTHRTTGAYGTGWGRILRVDERGENVMWLHPSNNMSFDGFISSTVWSKAPIYVGGGGIALRNNRENPREEFYQNNRNFINHNTVYPIRFGSCGYYHDSGFPYTTGDRFQYESSDKHPEGINFHLYILGDIRSQFLHGDGSKLVFPQTSVLPGIIELGASGGPPTVTYVYGKRGYLDVYSDFRLKSKFKNISHALDKLSRLVPKLYDKDGNRESGFIAQEMYYDVKELRHIVWPGRDANPNDDTPEPDYSDWGKRHTCLRYLHFIAYVVKSIQELRERIERLKNNKK